MTKPDLIPKIIHCCWFGGNPIPEELQQYMKSWNTYCPDWKVMLWNENNFNIDAHTFTKSAYEHKKYAFVSDYVRAWALYEYGGVYLDTDVELKQSLDIFCQQQAFSGFERTGMPFTAIWGAMPQHALCKSVLDYYQDRLYSPTGEPPNTTWIAQMICDDYGIDAQRDEYQAGQNGASRMAIYPSTYFCLDLPINYATHHFFGSWLPIEAKKISYKQVLHARYYQDLFLASPHISNNSLRATAPYLSIWQILRMLRYRIRWVIQHFFAANTTPK